MVSIFFRRVAPWVAALVVAAQPLATLAYLGSDKIPETGLSKMGLTEAIGKIIGTGLEVLGIVALGLIIYAGFMWMTAQGETEKVEKARSILVEATAGLIIIALAYSISFYITNQLGTALNAAGSKG